MSLSGAQVMVREFFALVGQHIPSKPTVPPLATRQLRRKLVLAGELAAQGWAA